MSRYLPRIRMIGSYDGHKTDKHGCSKITFEFPESELAEVAKIILFKEKTITITVEEEDAHDHRQRGPE